MKRRPELAVRIALPSDIHAAVEALVGEPVPRSSVKGALASDVAGSSGRLVRVARGRYELVEAVLHQRGPGTT